MSYNKWIAGSGELRSPGYVITTLLISDYYTLHSCNVRYGEVTYPPGQILDCLAGHLVGHRGVYGEGLVHPDCVHVDQVQGESPGRYRQAREMYGLPEGGGGDHGQQEIKPGS